MKKFIATLVLLSFFAGVAQNVEGQSNNREALIKVISQFFDGLQNGDTITLKKTIADNLVLQTAYINKEGQSILRTDDVNRFKAAIGSKKPEDKWEEKLSSYNINIDGNMANVWTPYEFYLNDKFSHCGVNSFQLFHDGSQWKIIYLIDTRRRKGCDLD